MKNEINKINNTKNISNGKNRESNIPNIILFCLGLLLLFMGKGEANNTLVISGVDNSGFNKSKILLLRPCIEIVEKREIFSEKSVNADGKKELTKEVADDHQKSEIKKNEINKIDDLLEYLEEEKTDEEKQKEDKGKYEKNGEKEEKKDDGEKKEDKEIKKNEEKTDYTEEEVKIEEKIFFKYFSGKNEKVLTNIYSKVIDNLNTVGLYDVKYNKNSCQEMTNFFEKNDSTDIGDYIFSDELKNNDYVIGASLELLDKNELKIQLYVWDMLDGKFTSGKYYIIKLDSENNIYRLSNMIADFIFRATTGENQGIFDSKIIYVAETGSPLNREKQVAIMNFDGTKNTKITKNKNMKLTPIFSRNNSNEIFYMEYLPEGAFVVKHDLVSGQITKILTKDQSMTSAVNSNPNGKNQVILAGTKDRETNLFLFDFTTKKNRQITKNKSINTAPSFSPDGDKIVYVSDRTGSRKLYIKDLDSNKDELLTKESGVYDKPAWSPDGRLIAFIKLSGGKFQLGVMTYNGTAERILTSDYLIEGVKWSPNSRYLIYTKQKGPYGVDSIPKIYIRDILTGFEYKLKTPKQEGASDPDWIMNF